MSLLMNALKKAETAKQAGQIAEPDSVSGASITTTTRDLTQELGLDPPPRSAAADPASSAGRPGPLLKPMELTLEPDGLPQAAPAALPSRETPGSAARGASASRSKEAAGARAVFAAKQPKPRNPQLPFYAVVGVCLLTAVGYGAYLWWQMQPPRPVMAANPAAVLNSPARAQAPAAPLTQTPSAIANQSPNASEGASSTGQALAPSGSGGSGAPAAQPPSGATPGGDGAAGSGWAAGPSGTAARAQDRSASGDADRRFTPPREARGDDNAPPRTGRRNDAPARDTASAAGGASVESPANLRIARNATTTAVNPDVLTGYAALQAGDLDRAGQAYDGALRTDPSNRDALLGAATVLLRLNRTDAAEAYFRQTLRLHPGDPYATAQLASLAAQGDPVGALSQVNSLIAREAERPESGGGNGALAFVQGNQLSSQGRWPEAQQAYFNAHRADPGNADYCYNLAISLDRIREPRLARDFYSKALELARMRPASFDAARARARLAQLDAALK